MEIWNLCDFNDNLVLIDNEGYVKTWSPSIEQLNLPQLSIGANIQESWVFRHTQTLKAIPQWLNIIGNTEEKWYTIQCENMISVSTRCPKNSTDILLKLVDVTELSTLKEQIDMSRKMQAIGQLTTGIAHDFNNMLSGILSAAYPLTQQESSKKLANIITDAAHNAAELTDRILTFSRQRDLIIEPISVHRCIREATALVKPTIDPRINILLQLDAKHDYCLGTVGSFQSTIINIILNSVDALPNGGEITIATQLEQDDTLAITINDTGTGMDQNTLTSVFIPYFSTKSDTVGTGLGLSSAKDILLEMHGDIKISSIPSQGTCVTITIPTYEHIIPSTDNLLGITTGKARTILLVDNQKIVRESLVLALHTLEWTVFAFKNGRDAIHHLEKVNSNIDTVLIDGRLADREKHLLPKYLFNKFPHLPVIFTSTHESTEEINALCEEYEAVYLPKPFTPSTLVTLIEETLND